MKEIKNAIITSVDLDTERGLTMWINLDYGGSGQGFGGFLLYSKSSWDTNDENNINYCGHFIYRIMEVVGVEKFSQLKGSSVRVEAEHDKVHNIGHFLKDKWFNPIEEFQS